MVENLFSGKNEGLISKAPLISILILAIKGLLHKICGKSEVFYLWQNFSKKRKLEMKTFREKGKTFKLVIKLSEICR